MPCGYSNCTDCSKAPSHKLLPCGHTTCQDHFHEEAGSRTPCGHCGNNVNAVAEVRSARRTDPVHNNDAWSVNKTQQLFNSAGGDMNNGRNGNLPLRNIDNTTPTPAGSKGSQNPGSGSFLTPQDTPQQPYRYVPPALRGFQSDARPNSTISNMSFDTQPPFTPRPAMPPGPTRVGPWASKPSRFELKGGNYRYGPMQLSERFASLDPFSDAPHPSFSDGADHYAAPRIGNGVDRNFARDSLNGHGMSLARVEQQPIRNPAAVDTLGTNLSPKSRAVHLAAFIRSGGTEDPDDIDYGNPGPSRRYPQPPTPAPDNTPMPKGKVASAYSNALVSYDENEGNTKGNPAVYVGILEVPPPPWLKRAGHGYTPSLEQVFDSLPMIEACRVAKPTAAGIVKITNIPYGCTRTEIVAFLGRNAQILAQPEGAPFHAVHIMMDRHTGKTNEAFVELKTAKEASIVVQQVDKRLKIGRHAKIGDRDVTVTVVSQADFMAELFPRAKNVEWYGPVPRIINKLEEYRPGLFSTGFEGFLQNEELVFMAKHADIPQKSPFASRVLVRNYECLITTLHKYPWFSVDNVLLSERHALFDTTLKCIGSLIKFIQQPRKNTQHEQHPPTELTLEELVVAALTCPGFSEGQKATIALCVKQAGYARMTTARGVNFRFGGVDRFAAEWPFHALVKQPGAADDMIMYLAYLFRKATQNDQHLSLADMHSMKVAGTRPSNFGNIRVDTTGVTTLGDLGRAELRAIEGTLRRVLPSAGSMSSGTLTSLS